MLNRTTKLATKPAATMTISKMTISKKTLDDIPIGTTRLEKAVTAGDVKIDGNAQAFEEFMWMLDKYNFWFNIVTP